MKDYDPKTIESKWQKEWDKSSLYHAEDNSEKPKYYTLIEFPYPSGDGLHVGHPRPYIGLDIVSRKRRMEGFNVLYPIGWDAFGLPTENYALKTGKDPRVVTKENSDTFRRQIQSLGVSFDWSREINTTDPEYYKWTQWLFLKFLEHGLAYKAKMPINWCPKDKIGLANEEVMDGKCERCGTEVEQREREQWMLAITKYADRLEKDLDDVDYPERVKVQQKNWIGKSEGSEIEFPISLEGENLNFIILHGWTGRADKNFIPWLKRELESNGYQVQTPQLPDTANPTEEDQVSYVLENCQIDENTIIVGHSLGGIVAMKSLLKYNKPIRGLVLVAPAMDPSSQTEFRPFHSTFNWDFDFGKLKKLAPFRLVLSDLLEDQRITYLDCLAEKLEAPVLSDTAKKEHFTGKEEPFVLQNLIPSIKVFTTRPDTICGATFVVVSGKEDKFTGRHVTNPATKEKIPVWEAEYVMSDYGTGAIMGVPADDERDKVFAEKHNLPIVENYEKAGFEEFGKKVTKYKLRDWVFSRQRYWGEPIPVIHCVKCGIVPVPESELPVKLPEVKDYQPTETGESPLANILEWVNTKCPKCGGDAKRETDVMPNWAGSSWYFLAYLFNKKGFEDSVSIENWKLQIENFRHFMPVDWYNGGMEHTVLHLLYSRFWNKFLFDIGLVPTNEPYKKRTSHGLILAEGGEKMSKSKGNVVNPDPIVDRFGADTLRVYEMFMGPFEQAIEWNESSLVGPRRFLEKVWKLKDRIRNQESGIRNESLMHQTIKKVSDDIEAMKFNTAASTLMIYANELDKNSDISIFEYKTLLKLLAPFAPHITEELWSELGHKNSIHQEPWPKYDKTKLASEEVTIVVQVNGKVRGSFKVSKLVSEKEIQERALQLPEIQKWVGDKKVAKSVYVPGKLVNIVVS